MLSYAYDPYAYVYVYIFSKLKKTWTHKNFIGTMFASLLSGH